LAAAFQVGAAIWNYIAGLINGMIDMIWQKFVAPIAMIVNFIYNAFTGGFDGIGGAFLNMLGQMTAWLVGWAKPIAGMIDKIFGTNTRGWIEDNQSAMRSWGTTDNYRELIPSTPQWQLNRIDYGTAGNAGYAFGAKIDENLQRVREGLNLPTLDPNGYMEATAGYCEKIAGNTSGFKEDLVWLKDIAEREALNRVSIQNMSVDMSGQQNSFHNGADIEEFTDNIVEGLREFQNTGAEGEHE
jgi:hypothetical protein